MTNVLHLFRTDCLVKIFRPESRIAFPVFIYVFPHSPISPFARVGTPSKLQNLAGIVKSYVDLVISHLDLSLCNIVSRCVLRRRIKLWMLEMLRNITKWPYLQFRGLFRVSTWVVHIFQYSGFIHTLGVCLPLIYLYQSSPSTCDVHF